MHAIFIRVGTVLILHAVLPIIILCKYLQANVTPPSLQGALQTGSSPYTGSHSNGGGNNNNTIRICKLVIIIVSYLPENMPSFFRSRHGPEWGGDLSSNNIISPSPPGDSLASLHLCNTCSAISMEKIVLSLINQALPSAIVPRSIARVTATINESFELISVL